MRRLAGRPQFLEIEIAITHRLVSFVSDSYFNFRTSNPVRSRLSMVYELAYANILYYISK